MMRQRAIGYLFFYEMRFILFMFQGVMKYQALLFPIVFM